MNKNRIVGAVLIAATVTIGLTACLEPTVQEKAYAAQDKKASARVAPDVTGDTEYNNYIKAQELYDDPANILWCTASFPSTASPIFTVPIAGKLTSSSVSYFPGASVDYSSSGNVLTENRSVDGMFHGSPGPYRYGFTPAGQYVDFTNLAVFCTTALTEFQRQSLEVSVSVDDGVTVKAEELLKNGDAAGAQALIDGITK